MKMFPSTILVSVFLMVIGPSLGRSPPGDIVGRGREGRRLPMGSNSFADVHQAFKYLKRYGYLNVDSAKTGQRAGGVLNITKEVRLFQEYMGLPVTASLDEDTMAVIRHSRCGVVDPVYADEQTQHKSFTLLGGKWNQSDITYRIHGSVSGYTKKRLAAVVKEAFDLYTPYVPLTFTSASKRAQSDILIQFRSIDDDPNMDGPGKSVGWAYPPLADSGDCGKIYIDADEAYTTDGPDGIPLLAVVAHQIGHALGLGHTSHEESVMTPCVPSYSPDYHLAQVDIDALNQLYGTSNYEVTDEVANENILCSMESYDAVTVMDGFLYVFNGDRFWKLTTGGSLLSPSEGVLISSMWPEVEGNIDVLFKNSLGHVVIIKGGKYYEYDVTGILFPWAPSSTRAMKLPKNAEAGYSIPEYQSSFFIRSGKLWFMDEVTRTVHRDSPKSIRKLWKVTIDHADGAFLLNGYLYILDGQSYMRLEAGTAHLDQSGSQNFAEDFLGC